MPTYNLGILLIELSEFFSPKEIFGVLLFFLSYPLYVFTCLIGKLNKHRKLMHLQGNKVNASVKVRPISASKQHEVNLVCDQRAGSYIRDGSEKV